MSPDELTRTVERLRSIGTDLADVGVDDPAKIASDLASLCSDAMEPPVRPLIQVVEHEGRHLVTAEIPALDPSRRPSYYRGEGMVRGGYLRVGDGDHRMTSYEVQLVVASRGQPVEDGQAVPTSSPADLEPRMVASYLERSRRTRPYAFSDLDDDGVLRRARVIVDTDDGPRPTLAGLLALGSYPQEHLPQLFTSFVSYPTTEGAALRGIRFLDDVSLEGPVPLMVRDGLSVLRRNSPRAWGRRGSGTRSRGSRSPSPAAERGVAELPCGPLGPAPPARRRVRTAEPSCWRRSGTPTAHGRTSQRRPASATRWSPGGCASSAG